MKHLRRIVAGGVPTGQEFSAIFFSNAGMEEGNCREVAENCKKKLVFQREILYNSKGPKCRKESSFRR
ncbi:hypothetical protein FND36_07425 [Lachnospiraceae bacterium KGMB03038]|nr:hypothetical protein FND36_07425 [Lachnospiraceae bacterium KGMB03038]